METNYELPENVYHAFSANGKHAAERNTSQTQEDPPKEELPEDLKESAFDQSEAKNLYRAKYALEDMATTGTPHHEILNAAKSIPVQERHIAADSHLHNLISSAPSITPEIHEAVRQTLRNHPGVSGIPIHAKYSWVLHHPDAHVEPPVVTDENAHDMFIPKEHIQKYLRDNFSFNGGRIVTDEVTKSKHYLHTDGSITPFYGYGHDTSNLPFSSSTHGHEVQYHHEALSDHYNRQINDQPYERMLALKKYTEDSVGLNRAAAFSNTKKKRVDDKEYFDDSTSKPIHTLDSMLKDFDPHPGSFKVYSGLSRSTDPSTGKESAPGKKTAYFPSFISTSLHDRTATGFAKRKIDPELNHEVRDVMEINIPKWHSAGAYVDSHSSNSGEHEYLLTHGHVIEHDAEPKYFVSHNEIHRFWANGQIKGLNQHPEWKLADTSPDKMTPEVTKQMEKSHIPAVRDASAFSQHTTPDTLSTIASKTNDIPTLQRAVSHPNLDGKSLANLLKREDNPLIHRAATNNPNYNDDHAFESVNQNPNSIDRIIAHPKVSTSFAMFAANHQNPKFRVAAINSGKLDNNEIEKKLDDDHPSVVHAAKLKLGKIEEELNQLILAVTEAVNKTSLNTA